MLTMALPQFQGGLDFHPLPGEGLQANGFFPQLEGLARTEPLVVPIAHQGVSLVGVTAPVYRLQHFWTEPQPR